MGIFRDKGPNRQKTAAIRPDRVSCFSVSSGFFGLGDVEVMFVILVFLSVYNVNLCKIKGYNRIIHGIYTIVNPKIKRLSNFRRGREKRNF